MFQILYKYIFILSFIVSGNLMCSDEMLKLRMISDLEIIKNTYDVCYAPADWKKQLSGWNLNDEFENAKAIIQSSEPINTKDYQRIVRRFLLSTRDYHVAPLFYSTELSYLPFRIQSAGDRYFITQINTRSVVYPSCPVQIGDEIISFDNTPIHESVQAFKLDEFGNPDSYTDQGMAEGFFTSRLGALGHRVPSGPVKLAVRQKGTQNIVNYSPTWDYHPEQIQPAFNRKVKSGWVEIGEDQPLANHPFFTKKMGTPIAAALKDLYNAIGDTSKDMIGSALDISGANNQIVYRTGSNFYQAYIYETPKRQRIGYIRLPTYHAGYDEAQEFSQIISVFQGSTDALIIDQQNNPGGYFFYMYALLSMLTDRPLSVPLHIQTLTQEDVSFALQYLDQIRSIRNNYEAQRILGSSMQGYTVDYKVAQQFKSHFQRIIDEWNEEKILTSPIPLYGIDEIQPHPTSRYTKPILVLINHMDFSCADFLPAILQDNGRAVLFGTPTAGAGGFVLKASHPNRFGISSYSYTGSIAERKDHRPIENLGVSPDIPYKMSINDLCNGYCDYYLAIQGALDQILQNSKH